MYTCVIPFFRLIYGHRPHRFASQCEPIETGAENDILQNKNVLSPINSCFLPTHWIG